MSRRRQYGLVCKEDGCDASLEKYHCRGYCLKHYRIRRLTGEFGGKLCTVTGCTRYAVGLSLCELHRNRYQRLGRVELDDTETRVGSLANSWRGGRSTNAAGYIRVALPPDHPQFEWGRPPTTASRTVSRTILEHRLVMGVALGRPLRRSETVHHINGDRADNRLENLQLRNGPHGVGVRLECRACGSHDVEPVAL